MNQARNHFLDGLEDASFGAAPAALSEEDIRKNAHIANGGNAKFECPACKGSGRFISYAGRVVGNCFKCKGAGSVSKGVLAAVKGKATKAANDLKWRDEHKAEIAYAHKRKDKGSSFYASLVEKLNAYGSWSENQLALIQRDIDKDSEFWAKKKAEQEAAAPKVDISAIEALFAKAVDNDVKGPVFRADGLKISPAKANSKNPGALYVKSERGDYWGKIAGGKFHKAYEAPADLADRLMKVAADPLAEAIEYGRKFGRCALCGLQLVDPVSIRSKVGPICAPKWGLDWKRAEARAELLAEKLAEKEAQS